MKIIDKSNKHKRQYIAFCDTVTGKKIIAFDNASKVEKFLDSQLGLLSASIYNSKGELVHSFTNIFPALVAGILAVIILL